MMKSTWTKNNNLSVSLLMETVGLNFAKVACTGSVRDESLFSAVASTMLDLGRRSKISSAWCKQMRAASGVDVSWSVRNMQDDHAKALRDAGRTDGLDPDDVAADDEGLDLEAARPLNSTRPLAMTLALHAVGPQGVQHSIRRGRCKGAPPMLVSDRAQQVLSEATRSGVAALPLWHERGSSSSSKPADSVMKERLKSWLDSDSGRAWQMARDKRVAEST